MVSLSNSSRLPANTAEILVTPVMFPPGRARLSTSPAAMGSAEITKTIGIVLVAFLAARAPDNVPVRIMSTSRRTSSSARVGSSSSLLSAYRDSKAMFLPSTYPSARSSTRNCSSPVADPEALTIQPILDIFFGCWASANEAVGSRAAATKQTIIFVFIVSASPLSNLLIRSCLHVRRNRETDLFGGFQIDDKLKLRRSLNRQVTGLGTFKDFVHKVCAAPK